MACGSEPTVFTVRDGGAMDAFGDAEGGDGRA
jgi:hypothetical protein